MQATYENEIDMAVHLSDYDTVHPLSVLWIF